MGTAKHTPSRTTDRKPVRRIIVSAVIFLLVGAIVNVAVAWACALWLPMDMRISWESGRSRLPNGMMWIVKRITSPTRTRLSSEVYVGFATGSWGGPSERLLDGHWGTIAYPNIVLTEEAHRFGLSYVIVDEAHGWPMRVLWCSCSRDPGITPGSTIIAPRMHGGIWLEKQRYLNGHRGFGRALPYLPIWPGFVINTLFYAMILFILISVPFIAQRMIRKRKGRCTKCGYDLRGGESGVCPECGHCITPAQAGVQ